MVVGAIKIAGKKISDQRLEVTDNQ